MQQETLKNTKKVVYLITFTLVALVVSLAIFVVDPFIERVYEAKDSFEKDKMMFEILKQDASKSKEFADLMTSLGDGTELLENALLRKDNLAILFEDIEKIATDAGVELIAEHFQIKLKQKKVSTLASKEEQEAQRKKIEAELEAEKKKVRIKLLIKGNYKKFLRFFYKLDNMIYVFNIESISLKNTPTVAYGLRKIEDLPPDYTEGEIVLVFTPK